MTARPPGIRSRLILAFALQLALVAGVAAVGLFGLRSVRNAFQTAIDRGLEAQRLAAQIKTALYAARRAEVEFLRHWPSDLATARERVAHHRRHVARLNQLIQELEQHEATGVPTYPPRRAAEDLVALKPYVNVYAEDFEEAVTLIGARRASDGYLDDGLRALGQALASKLRDPELRSAGIDDVINLRRHEREYLLLGRAGAVQTFRAQASALEDKLSALSPRQKVLTLDLLSRYVEGFEAEMTLVEAIGKRIAAFQAHAEVVEPLVDDIALMGQQEARAAISAARSASNRTVWGVMVALLVAMGTGITLASVLGHQITAPLTQLARTVKAIGGGDLSAKAVVRSRDEIGTLAQTFNAMTTRVRELVRSLEDRVRERELAEAEVRRLNAELEGRVKARTGELESANIELEAFTYSVSHDLRTPLRHIAGFVYLLRRQSPALDQEALGHLTIIESSVKRMGALIDGLLAFSRIGRAELAREPVDLAALVGEARQELEPETTDRQITWRIGPLPAVTADRLLLRQVLVNLISNAIKFTRPMAKAEVEIAEAPSRARPEEVLFFVRDNGVGFDMNFADKLFGVFKRLHLPEQFEGTGIGLANVERIVRRHGGRVWAESEVGKGATFFVALPRLITENIPVKADS